MSDKVFLPDSIPDGFEYAQFGQDSITLYNEPSGLNENLEYYRIHYGYSSGLVTNGVQSFGNYEQVFDHVETSREFFDRPDSFSIVIIIMIISVFALWLFNLMSSIVKKNGLLSGLL